MRTLVWFRGKDLRVADHAPLTEAVAAGEVIPLFVIDPFFFAPARAAELPHRMQFLVESLTALHANIAHLGSELVLLEGKSVEVIAEVAHRLRVDRVVAHRWTEPFGRARDARIGEALRARGVRFDLFDGETMATPTSLRTQGGTPFSVFTPFSKAFRAQIAIEPPLGAPRALPPLPSDVARETLPRAALPTMQSLALAPNARLLPGGERAARQRLAVFIEGPLGDYDGDRDRMDRAGTSRLSADLKFGTLSPRAAWHAAERARSARASSSSTGAPAAKISIDRFQTELLWREFAYACLWDRPSLLTEPFRADFAGFPWTTNDAHFDAWRWGTTGYPIVDASARQLLGEGFVHNRARMISASFLTKHLLADFRRGEAHYLKWLTDGDWAANDLGWQWSAGCGCDAQPYFRVFHPVTQGQKFDPDGSYVRRWVPELARMPTQWIHAPWEAPTLELLTAGVRLGENYPRPIVDHKLARARFLDTAKAHLSRGKQSETRE